MIRSDSSIRPWLNGSGRTQSRAVNGRMLRIGSSSTRSPSILRRSGSCGRRTTATRKWSARAVVLVRPNPLVGEEAAAVDRTRPAGVVEVPDRTTPPGSVGGGPGIGGGGPGRRNPAGSAPGVPGSGLSRGGGPGQTPQAAPPPTSGFPTPAAPGRSGTTGAPPTATLLDLNTAAPMPKQPPRYPANTTYYEVPITFTVEILKQPAAPKPDRSVVAPHSEQGSSA